MFSETNVLFIKVAGTCWFVRLSGDCSSNIKYFQDGGRLASLHVSPLTELTGVLLNTDESELYQFNDSEIEML